MPLVTGTRLGPYEILEPLGQGGMGEVYRARDVRIGRDVAVKLLRAQLAADPGQRERFEREARAVGSLSHPNLLVLFDLGDHDGLPFLVTELVEGEPLRRALDRGRLELERALTLAAQIARGLAAAHERGVVHRDLKPENVLLARDGRVKILDFGLARFSPGGASADLPTVGDQQLTAAGDLLGTPAYMAPEQVRGGAVDARADLFALGVVLYEMLFGRRPFEGDSPIAILSAILHHPLPELGADASFPPPAVRALLARCLARDPGARFSSATALAERLESLNETARTPSGSGRALDEEEIRSLAVLPFANRTGAAAADFLADGIAEQILDSLSQLAGLKVLARATCFRFRARLDEPIEVGRELGVRAVVTGRLLQISGRLLVKAELTDVATEAQLWGEQYDRPGDDLLAVQSEIGGEVAGKLRGRLTHHQRERLAHRPTESPRAYEAYLEGRYFLNKRTVPDLRHALERFRLAAEADPKYALAWSGLADAWQLLGRYGGEPAHVGMPRARDFARRAIALGAGLAEPHASLGMIIWKYDFDLEGSEREFRRALELNPGYALAHHWLAFVLGEAGRAAEARREIERALDLDPLSLIISANAGTIAYWARDDARALAQLGHALELEPHFVVALQWRGRVYEALGRFAEAITDFEAALERLPDEPETIASLAHALGRSGRRAEAMRRKAELEVLAVRRYVPPYWSAVLLLGLGETELALDRLEQAVDERFDWVVGLGVEPLFDELRRHPRFAALVERIGLPQAE